MASLCQCGRRREQRIAGQSSKFPGRPFYKCDHPECGKFDWADQKPSSLYAAGEVGPDCTCGKATVQRTVKKDGPNKGRKFWSCAAWPRGCGFFKFKESPPAAASPVKDTKPSPTKKRPPLPGHATYFTDWNKCRLLQELINAGVDPKKMKTATGSTYDSLEVVGAWHISNPSRWERYEQSKQREREKAREHSTPPLALPDDYARVMTELGQEKLDSVAGEVLLLHGTDPANLHNILFEGLDPEVARNGKFGRGVYFAENAAKIDQYATMDRMYDRNGPLAELHSGLYGSNMHPKRVRYCLVARVVLGRHVRTENGMTQLESERDLFSDTNRSQLSPLDDDDGDVHPSCLVAERGNLSPNFREFVVFQPDQIFVEYVIAYHRVRRYCNCGEMVTKRTVTKEGENRGREFHFCGSEPKSCAFTRMLPLCDCGQSADIKTSHSTKNPGKKYYTCHRRACNYFEWCGETSRHGTMGSPYKKQRT